MDLVSLFGSYGWHIAVVGLLGMILVELLKTPFKSVVNKIAKKEVSDSGFDTSAFLFGFLTACALGATYSYVAVRFGWLYVAAETGEKVLYTFATYTWEHWIFVILGVWSFQVSYYNIWKKLGIKRLFVLIGKVIASVFKCTLDKNKDGVVTPQEAVMVLNDLLRSGKLTVAQVLAAASASIPQVATDVISQVSAEAGEEVKVNVDESVEKLKDVAQAVVDKIPQENLKTVVSGLIEEAGKKVDKVVDTVNSGEAASVPKRPTVKF